MWHQIIWMFLYEQINLIITTRNFCEKVIFTGFSTPPNFYKAIYFLRVFTNMRGKLLMESNMKLLCFLMMYSFCEQDIWQKLKKINQAKLNKTKNIWYLPLRRFWLLLPNIFSEETGMIDCVPPSCVTFLMFPNLNSFLYVLKTVFVIFPKMEHSSLKNKKFLEVTFRAQKIKAPILKKLHIFRRNETFEHQA